MWLYSEETRMPVAGAILELRSDIATTRGPMNRGGIARHT